MQRLMRGMGAIGLLAWLSWVYVIIGTSPEEDIARLLFFGLSYVALFATLTLVLYSLSFQLFASKGYRGNVSRSAQQAAIAAAVIVMGGLLQAGRALTVLSGFFLAGVFVIAEIVVLVRR